VGGNTARPREARSKKYGGRESGVRREEPEGGEKTKKSGAARPDREGSLPFLPPSPGFWLLPEGLRITMNSGDVRREHAADFRSF